MCSDHQTRYVDAEALKVECEGRWLEILSALAPGLNPAIAANGKHVPCPVHGGKDGFRLFKDANFTGGGICNTCDGGKGYKSGISLLMWYYDDMDYLDVLHMIADYIGFENREYDNYVKPARPIPQAIAPAVPTAEEIEKQKNRDKRICKALTSVWRESVSITNPEAEPARLYFARRGLRVKFLRESIDVRFHSCLPYYHVNDNDETILLGRFPAIVCRVRNADGNPVTIHRTYLTDEGFKADVPSPKKMMPAPSSLPISGCAIRLMDIPFDDKGLATKPLALAEGLETSYAVIEAHEGRLPVWSTINSTLLGAFQSPNGVTQLIAYGDQDKSGAGEESLLRLKERANEDGIEFKGWIPSKRLLSEDKKSVDWLDVYIEHPESIPLSI